jgi:hypothetical protein
LLRQNEIPKKVPSQAKRGTVEQLAAAVPNARQVVNELEVKDQKASSSY